MSLPEHCSQSQRSLLLQLSWGQNSQAQTVTESIYYHRGNQEPTPGSLGSACDWERAVGRTPISHVWAVSDQQVCWVQESWRLGFSVCMAPEVSLNRLLLDNTKDSQNQGQELHRHQLKMEIRLGSLHQDVHFTLITKHKEGCTGLYWMAFEIRCFQNVNIGRAFPLATSKQHTIYQPALKVTVISVICYYLGFEQN